MMNLTGKPLSEQEPEKLTTCMNCQVNLMKSLYVKYYGHFCNVNCLEQFLRCEKLAREARCPGTMQRAVYVEGGMERSAKALFNEVSSYRSS